MPTPRERFFLTGVPKKLESVLGSEPFSVCCDYALLELQYQMPVNKQPEGPIDPCLGLDSNAQIQGAMRVLEILKTLHVPIETKKPPKRETLNYG